MRATRSSRQHRLPQTNSHLSIVKNSSLLLKSKTMLDWEGGGYTNFTPTNNLANVMRCIVKKFSRFHHMATITLAILASSAHADDVVVYVAPYAVEANMVQHVLEEPPPVASLEKAPDSPVKFTGWRCDTLTGCPAGTIKILATGAYAGCTSTCAGSCVTCSGSTGSLVKLCVRFGGEECLINPNASINKCGFVGVGACGGPTPGAGDINDCTRTPGIYTTEARQFAGCV